MILAITIIMYSVFPIFVLKSILVWFLYTIRITIRQKHAPSSCVKRGIKPQDITILILKTVFFIT